MIATLPIPENPYVSLKNDVVSINCGKTKLKFHTVDISKIYLAKNENYWHRLIGNLLAAPSIQYDLHIETTAGRGICITINALERFYFIRLIMQLRYAKKPAMTTATNQLYHVRIA